jgi:hypothetical protein
VTVYFSVNTFPLLGSRFVIMQQLDCNSENGVFYVVRAEILYAKYNVSSVEVASRFYHVPYLYNMYINDAPQTPGVYLALFAGDTCLCATDRKEDFVVIKLQRGLSPMETWCERCNITVNEDKTRGDRLFSQPSIT